MNLKLIESFVELIELGAFANKEDIAKGLKSAIKATKESAELTDEEIYTTIFESGFDKELFMQNINSGVEPISLTLAKAILRKAQEI